MADNIEAAGIQWHPAFYGAAELEFLSNKEIYEAIRRRDKVMCEALRELMKEDFEQMKEDFEMQKLEMIKNLMDTMKWTAEQAMAALKIPDADKGKYIAKL